MVTIYADFSLITEGTGAEEDPINFDQTVSEYYLCSLDSIFMIKNKKTINSDVVFTNDKNITICMKDWDAALYGPWGIDAEDGATIVFTNEIPG